MIKNGGYILGTANFGMNYGMPHISTELSLNSIEKILITANENGICKIDTAVNYGKSEFKLGKIGVDNFEIYSKISDINTLHSSYECLKTTEESIKKLNLKCAIKGILVHFNDNYKSYDWGKINYNLSLLKKSGLVTSVGISIYDPTVIKKFSELFRPEIVQAPYNIFDRRIEKFLRAQNITRPDFEVIIRSIFLQGVLFEKVKNLPDYFKPWKKYFLIWEKIQKTYSLSPLELAICFVKEKFNFSNVVIGVENHNQLLDIIKCSTPREIEYPRVLENIHNENLLINPYNWKFK